MTEQLEVRRFDWRRTRYEAITQYIIFLPGKGIVKPTHKERSRTGNHGKDVYILSKEDWSKAWVIGLFQSNTGKRSIEFRISQRELKEDNWLCIREICRMNLTKRIES